MRNTTSFFALMLLAAASFSAEPVDVEAEYKQGRASWDAGDVVGSIKPLKAAADGGHAAAQALYGTLLDAADSDAEAATYYEKAANQGNPDGMLGLAGLLITGDGGEKNPKKALPLMEKAALQGHRPSVVALALGYASDTFGLGEESKNSGEAWNWIRKAAELENLESMALLENAYRQGNAHVKQDLAAAEALRVRALSIQGIDPNAKKKRQRR